MAYQDDTIDSRFRSHREYYVDAFSRETQRIWQGLPNVGANPDEVADLCYFRSIVAFYSSDRQAVADRRRLLYSYLTNEFSIGDESDTLNRYRRILPIKSQIPRLIRNLCTAYNEPPKRILSQSENVHKALADLYETMGVDAALDSAYMRAKLCGVVAVRPVTVEGVPRLDVMTPDLFRVEAKENDLYTAASVSYVQATGSGNEYVTWTAETITKLDGNGDLLSQEPNPYGVLPFVFLRLANGDTFYGGGMMEAVEDQLDANKLRFLSNVNVTFAGSPVWFGINLKRDNIQISPDRVITFDGVSGDETQLLPPSLEAVSPDGQYAEVDNFRKERERGAALASGLPASILNDGNGVAPSGVARIVERAELMEQRNADIKALRAFEQALAQMVATVVGKDTGASLDPSQVAVSVDFAEERVYVEPDAEYNLDKMKVADGAMDPVEFYRKWSGLDAAMDEAQVTDLVRHRRELYAILTAPTVAQPLVTPPVDPAAP